MVLQYAPEIIDDMRSFYHSLSEKDRRRYAAIEAKKLGHGGITYILNLLDCNMKTIRKGIAELADKESMGQSTIRLKGGGRSSKLETYENIDQVFLDVLREHTAGSPMNENVKWTNLTRGEISEKMAECGIEVSKNIVRKLLKKHDYVKRKALKKKAIGQNKDRDQQFRRIVDLRSEYEQSGNPIISIDAKKKN